MTFVAHRTLALVLSALALAAHAAPPQVRSMTLKPGADAGELGPAASGWADGSVKMPFVEAGNPVANRINEALFLDLLGTAAPQKPGTTFTPPASQLPLGTASQDFEVSRNDSRILAITLSAEGCGAYCESYDTVYNFDARTGWLIALKDLVQPGAIDKLGQRVSKEANRRYAAQIKALKQELAASRKRKARPDAAEIDDLQQRLELNEGCLSNNSSRDAASVMRYAGLSLAAPGLTLNIGRCSNHAMRALDDVGDMAVTVPPAELRPMLTAYGRTVVLGEGDASPPAEPFGQVLHGKIGQSAITFRLNRPEAGGAISGHYYYDRYRQPIPLSGQYTDNTLTLTETADDKQATLRLQRRAATLQGEWQAGDRRLPVTLAW